MYLSTGLTQAPNTLLLSTNSGASRSTLFVANCHPKIMANHWHPNWQQKLAKHWNSANIRVLFNKKTEVSDQSFLASFFMSAFLVKTWHNFCRFGSILFLSFSIPIPIPILLLQLFSIPVPIPILSTSEFQYQYQYQYLDFRKINTNPNP